MVDNVTGGGRASSTTVDRRCWHVVGDSHAYVFRWAASKGLIERRCLVSEVIGATAVGLRNPNAATNAIGIFTEHLLPFNAFKTPVIQLGEVDCGFVIWYRAAKYGESVEDQVDLSIAAYFEFVDLLVSEGYRNVVITAATVPTIRDGQDWGGVANARREVTATLRQRTDLTLAYNARLRGEAASRALPFIDLTDMVLDRDTGLVADCFRHPNPANHHLDPEKLGPLWAAELNRLSQAWGWGSQSNNAPPG